MGIKEDSKARVPLLNDKLYLVRDNHDRRSAVFCQSKGITLVKDPYLMYHISGLRLVFSHRPIVPLAPGMLNLHGHIHNNLTPELGRWNVILCIEVRTYRPWRLDDVLQPYLE